MNLTEKTLSQEYKYKGRIVNLRVDEVELPGGHTSVREVVEHPGGVCVAALTDREELLFIRQFRYPYQEAILELPAGKRSPGEDPLECGIRELKEETGAVAARVEPLGRLYPSPGYTDEIIYLFLATGLSFGDSHPDDDEFLEPERLPLEEAVRRVMDGELDDAKTQIAVLKIWERKRQRKL